jgi:PelA/Pel-15E family pectate lyase
MSCGSLDAFMRRRKTGCTARHLIVASTTYSVANTQTVDGHSSHHRAMAIIATSHLMMVPWCVCSILVREVATTTDYDFVEETRRKAAAVAFDRGIECILKCQIRVDGQLTVWCAQHDEIDFRPQPARTYELATLSGAESVGITRLLMSIDSPSPEIVKSVDAAVSWFGNVKLTGIRVAAVKDDNAPKGVNRVVVADPQAPPLWARFYDIETNAPVFADRDRVPRQTLADIGYERRNGYAWYGNWPQKLLDGEYDEWKRRIATKPNE